MFIDNGHRLTWKKNVVFMGFNVNIKIFMVQKHEDCKTKSHNILHFELPIITKYVIPNNNN
jgi:hypothetical protein